LGVVDAIAGSTRIELTFSGNADHSGATPMFLRHDALVAASELVIEAEHRAASHRTAVATVGNVEVEPGSFTTVPGLTRLSLDVRDVDSERQRELAEELLDGAARIAARRGLEVSAVLVSDQSPVVLHKPVREQLARTAHESDVPFCVLPSGASHDTAYIAKAAPAGMVFVPCKDGISHSPEEWSNAEDIARGAEVVAATLKALDEQGVA
jgi:hydantoinase/carbamoylase family amidase